MVVMMMINSRMRCGAHTWFSRFSMDEPTAFSAAFWIILWSTLRKKLYSQLRIVLELRRDIGDKVHE
jgi:hypothetical protein